MKKNELKFYLNILLIRILDHFYKKLSIVIKLIFIFLKKKTKTNKYN